MAGEVHGNFVALEAGADLHAKQYYIAKEGSTNLAVLAAAATDAITGVLDEVPQGSAGLVSIAIVSGAGFGKVKCGASSISKGAYLTSDANGLAVTTTNAGDSVFGRAREDATSGQVFSYEKMAFRY